jgi:DNA polymerase-3 subunit delta
MTFEQILSDLKKKIYHPVYFLQGEESFYIDQLSDYIEQNVLTESEKEFNQTIVYGRETDVLTLISYARRYPMMSNYQVIIVKEAQDMKSLFGKQKEDGKQKDDKDPFVEYLLRPTNSTLLVFCYKYGKLDKRTKAAKILDKSSVIFESKKLYDDQLPAWIGKYVQAIGLRINMKAQQMLAENLGNDLTKITNELGKLRLNLKEGQEITPEIVEENIGVSKDFNVFELQKALGNRNILKANKIINYFAANPKSNPMVMTIPQLYSYFLKVLTYHKLEDRTTNNAASLLGVNPYFLGDYIKAAKEYSPEHCVRNISYISEYDLRSKGVNNFTTNEGELMKELVYKILH